MNSLKKNVIYSSILTVSGYLFPLITFPYVTRVLGVNNIGICNFADSIVQYFIYFSMMGMMTVGIREVARTKGNLQALSNTFNSLLALNLIATVVAIILLLLCTTFVPQMYEHKEMFYIGTAKILANTLLVEWLFKGLEDFKYITARTIVIRGIYVLAVFIFVRDQSDYILYFALTSLMVVVNAVVNILYSKKFVKYSLKDISFTNFLNPFFILGIYSLLTSLYTTFNVAYLGFVSNTIEVGYYTTATKLYTIIMSFFTAFTGVMLPRMSTLLAEGKVDEFKSLTSKSVEVLLSFAIPLIAISEICAPQIIRIIAGEGYEGAIMPMRIVMPLMIIIGYEQILVLQMLSPMKKDGSILTNSMLGAGIALLMNILLVEKWASIGTSIVWICSELTVLASAQYFVKKYIGYIIPLRSFIYRVLLLIPLLTLSYEIEFHLSNPIVILFCVTMIALCYCFIVEFFILKNEVLIQNSRLLISKINMRNKKIN